ncbi:MAG: hypothetical protein JRI46_03575 [Deltaproteobacteria bacterium]|nr:hypothetical protein [Deltaproteobacteria bacterium]
MTMVKVPKLEGLQDHHLGPFTLQVQCRPKRKVGHFDLDLFFTNKKGKGSRDPIITGIYSKGNPAHNIHGWLDIHYLDRLTFEDGASVVLSEQDDLAEDLFQVLGSVITPGGLIIVSYITDIAWGFESPLHEITRRCLGVSSLNIPPAATTLGRLLVAAGCCNIKGGAYDVQGSSRLAGEKLPNREYEARFTQKLIEQLKEYLAREPNSEFMRLEEICRANATNILDHITKIS